jgi:integrase
MLAAKWETTVLPMFKHSTQKNRRLFLNKHLLPRFGEMALSEITREAIQAYVSHLAQRGYAPKSIDNIHDALSAILRTAVEWGHLSDNPAVGVRLPKLRTVRPKWALTTAQAIALIEALRPLPRTVVSLALLCGLRRGELFALRWADVHEHSRELEIRSSVYDGVFGTPKTEAGVRTIPLSGAAVNALAAWKSVTKNTEPSALVFATRSGKPISPNNILRRHVIPACEALGIPRCSWLTFRRTYSSWAHTNGVPGKVVARLMGHANVDTTLNVYTQVLDASMREGAEAVGSELFKIVQSSGGATTVTH